MHARLLALLCLVVLLSACGQLTLDDGDPRTGNTCVFAADKPHFSTHGAIAGRREINAVAWFKCSSSPPDVTLHVKLEELSGDAWVLVRPNDRTVPRPTVKKKYPVTAPIPCRTGTFRTTAQITGHDDDGKPGESTWDHSESVTDPCKGQPAR